jgi:hypothetical protein
MLTLLLWQAVDVPGWVGPTVAISLAVLALSFLGLVVAVAVAALRLTGQARKLSALLAGLQDDLAGALQALRRLTEQGQDLVLLLRHEAGAFAQTGRRLRRQVTKGADRIEQKLADLETLYDVVHEEVQDTALDVAAALRSARRGNGMLGRVRRFLTPAR